MIKRKKLKSIPKLLAEAQEEFNKYIRQRDSNLPCISCGKYVSLQAGHYFSVKMHGSIRFLEANVHGQCVHCNIFLGGNLAMYRIGLVERYGKESVEALESIALRRKQFGVKKWEREEIKKIIEKYKQR